MEKNLGAKKKIEKGVGLGWLGWRGMVLLLRIVPYLVTIPYPEKRSYKEDSPTHMHQNKTNSTNQHSTPTSLITHFPLEEPTYSPTSTTKKAHPNTLPSFFIFFFTPSIHSKLFFFSTNQKKKT